jgi:hypothetical protein
MSLALIAVGVIVAIAIVFFLRTLRQPVRMSDRTRNQRPDPADRPHRQAVHYRASGVLPRWDP